MWTQVVIPIIIVMLIIAIPNSAYAMKFMDLPPDSKKSLAEMVKEQIKIMKHGNLRAEFRPLYIVADDPALHVVPPGGTLDGVGEIIIVRTDGTALCSGALLTSGMHILTAAHCFTDDFGNLIATSASITFETVSGDETIFATSVFIHPDWDGDLFLGNDLVVLELASVPPSSIDRYDIDRVGADDVGTTGTKVGYGSSGTGLTGVTIGAGTKRQGLNLYDDVADTMLVALGLTSGVDFVPGSVLQYDFDNGDAANDAFGFFFGNTNPGLGNDEVNSAPGDSGGPTFSSPVITGVTSYGVRLTFFPCTPLSPCTSDIDGTLNSSFGEFSGDTRVSTYAAFVDAIVGQQWYADCDGDGFFRSTAVIAATEELANAATPCVDSLPPDGGWSNTVGTDVDDEDASEFPGQVWYADCDGDGFFRSTAVIAATEEQAVTPCLDGFAPDGGWSNTVGTDVDDEDASVVPCSPPVSGDWTITSSCTLSASSTAPANIIVQNNSVLTIPNGVTLTVPSGHNITVVSGSGILIKSGGTLRITV